MHANDSPKPPATPDPAHPADRPSRFIRILVAIVKIPFLLLVTPLILLTLVVVILCGLLLYSFDKLVRAPFRRYRLRRRLARLSRVITCDDAVARVRAGLGFIVIEPVDPTDPALGSKSTLPAPDFHKLRISRAWYVPPDVAATAPSPGPATSPTALHASRPASIPQETDITPEDRNPDNVCEDFDDINAFSPSADLEHTINDPCISWVQEVVIGVSIFHERSSLWHKPLGFNRRPVKNRIDYSYVADHGSGWLITHLAPNAPFRQLASVPADRTRFHFIYLFAARTYFQLLSDCPSCGYDIRSLSSLQCPECGFRLRATPPPAVYGSPWPQAYKL